MLSTRTTPRILLAVAGVLFVAGCGGDDPTAPEVLAPDFPALGADFATQFCIRGTLAPDNTVSGELTTDDCETVSPVGSGPGSYFEGWRVRVGQTGSVTIQTGSGYDTFVDLFRIDDLGAPDLENLIIFDDDSGPGDNGRFTITLQVDTEYWVMVSGFDAIDVGPYTLDARY